MFGVDAIIITQLGVLFILLIGGIEVVLRVKGKIPENFETEKSNITPKGKFYKEHSVLGYVHQAGDFKFNIKNRFNFTAKHNKAGHRISGEILQATAQDGRKPQIWIFGCSYTYGWLVNDNETYPWLLQEKLSNYKIENFGVNGYGTLQSYLQFNEALEKDSLPRVVILGYCDFHKQRNTVERQWKKKHSYLERSSPFQVPAARINKKGELTISYNKVSYSGIPFSSKSSLLDLIENRFNIYHDNKLNSWKVTEMILEKFHHLAELNGIKFIFAAISDNNATKKMLRIAHEKGIRTVDISVDRSKKSPEHTHIPHDSHPSPLAHKKYAGSLLDYLTSQNLVQL